MRSNTVGATSRVQTGLFLDKWIRPNDQKEAKTIVEPIYPVPHSDHPYWVNMCVVCTVRGALQPHPLPLESPLIERPLVPFLCPFALFFFLFFEVPLLK